MSTTEHTLGAGDPTSEEIVQDLVAVAPPQTSAYFFDVDGTLA